MTVLNESLLLGDEASGGYKIERSLRFNSADTAYLRRTPTSAGNRKTWTWSGWVKRCEFGASLQQVLLGSIAGAGATQTMIGFLYDNIDVFHYQSSTFYRSSSVSVIRDPSAWYHIVYAIDTTQASTSDRCKVYINGAQITMSAWTVPQNTDTLINAASQSHDIGTLDGGTYYKFNGYLADVHFIDGQALTPSSFGETDINGVWQPKAYSGTYGTNGFQLKFADNSAATATTLGKDTSGNSNNFTPNNLSVTAGAGNDSLVDSPTNYGTDTGAGGEARGNYCTLNPLQKDASIVLKNGNLDFESPSGWRTGFGTIAVSSGKWYWEHTIVAVPHHAGIATASHALDTYLGAGTGVGYNHSGTIYVNGGTGSTFASYGANDVIGVALNMDAGTIQFYKNGTLQGTGATGLAGTYFPAYSANGAGTGAAVNFGQRPFAYTAPSGFKALCTQNLPTPTITKPSTVMDVALWTGNGSARSITGLGFNPDLVWIKGRSGATDHALYDSVRGATLDLVSNSAAAETTQTQGLTAFNSDGFSLGTLAKVNTNAATYAGWVFDAGSSTVTNTAGTISSQVRANASAGFSIVTWTGTANASVGHGLNVSPALVITKSRTSAVEWRIWSSTFSNPTSNYLGFSTSAVQTFGGTYWGSMTSSTLGFSSTYDNNTGSMVAYCFAPVAGYSAFGSYTGNGSADGPFVYTGFRPRWLMIKSSSAPYGWVIHDTLREPYNVDDSLIYANSAGAEATDSVSWGIDILSNGFKIRTSAGVVWNNSGSTFIYAAFAEAPFALARAR